MPHNLAITLPGALEEIGLLSEANAQKPGFAEQHYIPTSPKILAKSTLLQPRDSQRLSFNVPKQPGIYPIVCTYPGHWRRMYAALYVVADLDAYEAAPEAYLAANKIEAADALLKDRRPRTEWKIEDLARQMGLSTEHFIRQFKHHFGTSPKAYHTRARLQEAARWLRGSDKPIKAIAYGLGFNDPKSFARRFKQHFGVKPSDLRLTAPSDSVDTSAASKKIFPMNVHLIPPQSSPLREHPLSFQSPFKQNPK